MQRGPSLPTWDKHSGYNLLLHKVSYVSLYPSFYEVKSFKLLGEEEQILSCPGMHIEIHYFGIGVESKPTAIRVGIEILSSHRKQAKILCCCEKYISKSPTLMGKG